MKQIIITISEDAEIRIETKGYTGKACLEDSDFIKKILGKELAVKLCPTYYQKKNKEEVHIFKPICG
jgi:hypothetical protein